MVRELSAALRQERFYFQKSALVACDQFLEDSKMEF